MSKFRVQAQHFCPGKPDYDKVVEAEDRYDAMDIVSIREDFHGYNDEVMCAMEVKDESI